MWLATPPAAKAKTAAMLGIDLGKGESREPDHALGPDSTGRLARAFAAAQHADRRDGRGLPRSLLRPRAGAAQRDHRQHHQLLVPDGRRAAASHAGAADARGAGGHAGGVGRDPAVPVLCRHRGDHHDDASQRAAGECVRQHFDAGAVFPRWWRSIRRCWACSCRQADRSG